MEKPFTVCVFCGSSAGNAESYGAEADEMGRLLAEAGCALVFGGGNLGLMGKVARAVRDGGATVTGILPAFLRHLEPPLGHGETVLVTPSLFERKDKMIAMADAFVVLPGGLGTMDEFFEVVTSAQLGVHKKPIAVVNTNGFFDPLQTLLEHMAGAGFVRRENLKLYRLVATPKEAMTLIQAAGPASRRGSTG
jgi:hypothetical protein